MFFNVKGIGYGRNHVGSCWKNSYLPFMMWVWASWIIGKLQTGDQILFVDGIDVKTININQFKEWCDKLNKTIRLQVQHDKGDLISESFSTLQKCAKLLSWALGLSTIHLLRNDAQDSELAHFLEDGVTLYRVPENQFNVIFDQKRQHFENWNCHFLPPRKHLQCYYFKNRSFWSC